MNSSGEGEVLSMWIVGGGVDFHFDFKSWCDLRKDSGFTLRRAKFDDVAYCPPTDFRSKKIV